MVQQWIDASAGLAYISVGAQLNAFDEFLSAIEKLIANPEWRPGMPVVEDIRQCLWIPPATAVEDMAKLRRQTSGVAGGLPLGRGHARRQFGRVHS